MFLSSIKEINRLKECQTFTIKNNWRSQNFDFLGKKTWKNAIALKSKKVKALLGKHLFWVYNLQLSFVYKTMSQISFNLFFLGDKRLLSEFLWKWGWFHELNERFPKHLG